MKTFLKYIERTLAYISFGEKPLKAIISALKR